MSTIPAPEGVEVIGEAIPATQEILTPEALAFVAKLHRAHNARRKELLAVRRAREAARGRRGPTSCPRPPASAKVTGPSTRYPPTCRTAASRSRGRSTARW